MRAGLILIVLVGVAYAPDSWAQELRPTDAISSAIEHNPRFTEAGLQVRESTIRAQGQQSIRPFTFSASGGFNYDEQPTAGVIEDGIRTSNFLSLSSTLAKQLVWGTQMSLQFDFNRSEASVPFNVPQFGISETRQVGPNYANLLQFSVTQPILQGFGSELNDLPLAAAEQQRTVAELQRRRVAHDLTAEVLGAYWNWVRAMREVDAVEASLERTQTLAELTRIQIESGQLAELERDIVDQRIASTEQTVLIAKNAAVDAWQALQNVMGEDYGDQMPEAPSVLPASQVDIPSTEVLVAAAEEANPDIELLDQDIRANQLQLRRSSNDVKPRLDAVGRIAQASLAEEIPDAFGQIGSLDFTSFFIGLNFVVPLDNGLANRQHEANQVAVERAKVRKVQALRELGQNVRQARRLLLTQRKRLALSEDEVKLARKNLSALNDKYAAGLTSYLEVLEQESALEDAELRNAQATVDVLQAEVTLRRITGSLLEAFDVELSRATQR